MKSQFFSLIIFFAFPLCILAAPPACAPGVRCPPGGMWGQWATFGSTKCTMDCGGCGVLFQTRTCMSTQISGCPCTGDASRYIPCNMQVCKYPAQKSCCPPYLPMVLDGVYTCGPLPKTMRDPGASCCPVGGLWSDYAGYERQGSRWVRTRKCLSAAIDCPCTGDSTEASSNCPCPQPTSGEAEQCTAIPNATPFYFRDLIINHDQCTAALNMVGHNKDPAKSYCNKPTINYPRSFNYVALLIMKEVNGGCVSDDVFDCDNNENTIEHMNATFTCDTNSLKWVYDFTGKQISSYIQGIYKTQT
ncbi:unnamed protein product [Caenorhabditis brenneri]